MSKVLVLAFSNLPHDARITRQINWLSEDHMVTVVCFQGLREIKNVSFLEIEQSGLSLVKKAFLAFALGFKLFDLAYRIQHPYVKRIKSKLKSEFDIIVANDIETLPLAFKLKTTAKVLFDAHEYAPRHFEDKKWWKLLFGPLNFHLCKKYIPKTAMMTTVCDGLMLEYKKNFGVKAHIITNATKYHPIQPKKVAGDKIRLVHHGIINRSRKVEKMVEVMKILGDDYELDFYFLIPEYASSNTSDYFDNLKLEIDGLPNVRVLPAIPNELIAPTLNNYDLGLFLLEPINFNYTHALPNKLFDFVQARLAIAIGPSIEMKKIVNAHNIGVVSADFDPQSLANSIKNLNRDDIFEMKLNSEKAAYNLSEEGNKKLFLQLVNQS